MSAFRRKEKIDVPFKMVISANVMFCNTLVTNPDSIGAYFRSDAELHNAPRASHRAKHHRFNVVEVPFWLAKSKVEGMSFMWLLALDVFGTSLTSSVALRCKSPVRYFTTEF